MPSEQTIQIVSREARAMRPVIDFFKQDINLKQLLAVVVLKTRNLPLRLLDWFVTNYAKKTDIAYTIKRPDGTTEIFRVYRSYRAQLKGNKKKEFDPFCRGNTITLEYESPEVAATTTGTVGSAVDAVDPEQKITFETALCQLKFFKWAIENLVLDYVEANYDVIYEDMKEYSSKSVKASTLAVNPVRVTPDVDQSATVPVPATGVVTRKKKTELSKSIHRGMQVSKFTVAHLNS